jgi:hypothetical protein
MRSLWLAATSSRCRDRRSTVASHSFLDVVQNEINRYTIVARKYAVSDQSSHVSLGVLSMHVAGSF